MSTTMPEGKSFKRRLMLGLVVLNWVPPGKPFWDKVHAHPDEPRILLRLEARLSANEYLQLCRWLQDDDTVPDGCGVTLLPG